MTKIEDPASGGWHLDKRVPLALIAVIVLQSSAALWWARGLQSAVETNQREIKRLDGRFTIYERERRDLNDRLIRVEEAIKGNSKLLSDLVNELRRQRK